MERLPDGLQPRSESLLAFSPGAVDRDPSPWSPAHVRKAASIRLGLLLAVSALLSSCTSETRPPEKRCVDGDGRFVDEGQCSATAGWDPPDDGAPERAPDGGVATSARGGYHFIWIPYGAFGGVGAYAPGFLRPGTGVALPSGAATSGSVSHGGFGATGAAHAGTAAAGTAAPAGS
jgi:hypothetical protein